MIFGQFFEMATGHAPYDYQQRLAGGDAGQSCESQLIIVPTGLGKTAAVVLAWLRNRVAPSLNQQPSTLNQPWPRRLVYCLPMRTLVEQTETEVRKWMQSLLSKAGELGIGGQALEDLKWLAEHSPVILMGGEELEPAKREWDLYPERPCILIGTQDMLLSRALNRGYGRSRYRWPMPFGLLNNDAWWVLDETQLMGPGWWTSGQLDWMRNHRFGTAHPGATWWMSATNSGAFLDTPDRRKQQLCTLPIMEIGDDANARVRLSARRPLSIWKPATAATRPGSRKKSARSTAKVLTGEIPDYVPSPPADLDFGLWTLDFRL